VILFADRWVRLWDTWLPEFTHFYITRFGLVVDSAACTFKESVSWRNAPALFDEGVCTTCIIIHSERTWTFRSQLIFSASRRCCVALYPRLFLWHYTCCLMYPLTGDDCTRVWHHSQTNNESHWVQFAFDCVSSGCANILHGGTPR
jgi:hypothetical protein